MKLEYFENLNESFLVQCPPSSPALWRFWLIKLPRKGKEDLPSLIDPRLQRRIFPVPFVKGDMGPSKVYR